jgi:hypothetical protein
MKPPCIFFPAVGFFCLVSVVWAQAPGADISPPKQRETLVSAAQQVLSARSAPVVVPDAPPDPFQWPVEPEAAVVDQTPAEVVGPPVMGSDLLAKLAAQIPVTGTVNLGGQPILLLGQKRLKVGDTITISFDGQNYDLSIAAIAPTSFSVKRGDLIHTRPTRFSTTSRP